MAKGFSKWIYRLTLARWYYNYAWGWIIGYFLSTFSMIVTIYYLIPGLRELFSFPLFLGGAGFFLIGGCWASGKLLVKRLKIQPIENYISTEINPFANAALTAKERVYWNAMVVLLEKEMARTPDAAVQKCVEQMRMYINGQVPFNFDELDNFQLGEQREVGIPSSKNVAKLSLAGELDDGAETAVSS
ncbi:MAG TPA: hypothetical protein VFE96_09120 [Candidatus Bathyarchaeia archaeon]|nr:hypothetical protein [Candidatus Bathyarchaeia archaeon]